MNGFGPCFRLVLEERRMKRLLLSASLVTFVTSAASANPIAQHAPAKPVIPVVHVLTYKVAPADEYFGRLKMSILGIRNTIKDDGLKVDSDPTQGPGVISSVAMTEDALHDWEAKYPRDTWLPHSLWTLERLYAKIDSDVARAKAKATMLWLVHDFPTSPQAKIGRVELASNKVGVKPVVATTAADISSVPAAAPSP
jgi:hypothetical protein